MLNLEFKSHRAGNATFSLSCSHRNGPRYRPSVFVSGLPSSSPVGDSVWTPSQAGWPQSHPSSLCLQVDVAWGVHLIPITALHKAPGLAQHCQIFTPVSGSPLNPCCVVGVDARAENSAGLGRPKRNHKTNA